MSPGPMDVQNGWLPDVEASALEIESQCGCDAFGEEPLAVERELAREHVHRRRRRHFSQRARQRNEVRFEAREEGGQPIGRHARLVVVEERVVSRPGVADGVGLLSRERKDLIRATARRT